MSEIVQGFGQFMPYVFMIVVVGIIWDKVISAFQGWFK